MLRRRGGYGFACFALVLLALNVAVRTGEGAPTDAKASLSPRLREVLKQMHERGLLDLTDASLQGSKNVRTGFTCTLCESVFKVVEFLMKLSWTEDAIADAAGELCTLFHTQMTDVDETVCKGIARTFKTEVLTVFGMVAYSPKEACGAYLGPSCGSTIDPFNQTWTIPVPGNKPPVKPVPLPKAGSPKTRILHLSDLHYDYAYREGLSNDCGEPLCCRVPNKPAEGDKAAGKWGDYQCDVPYRTMENLFQHLHSIQDQFDWVYWTGDMPAHDVWETTKERQLEILNNITLLMLKYLPHKIVFPAVGNHEGVPVNSFAPPFIKGDLSENWLYSALIKNWSHWLDGFSNWADVQSTILRGGFYSVKVREGLRVISVQTNFCNNENFWLLINATDPAHHLQWLIDELLAAEASGEKVHIISHIPPGSDNCLQAWSYNYYNIINRFESTIIGQFYGHTHHDDFVVFFDEYNKTRATSVAYVGHGVTSYQNLNFGYRIYTIDGDYNGTTSAVLDHENYIMNITEANLSDDPQWEFEYSAQKAYQLPSLQPAEWAKLVVRFKTDEPLLLQYHKYNWKSNPTPPGCNHTCQADLLCGMVKARTKDNTWCHLLLPKGLTMEMLTDYQRRKPRSC